MPRMPRPWRRKGDRGAWYAQVDGRKVRLAGPDASYAEAQKALAQRLAQEAPTAAGPVLTVRDVFNLHLAAVAKAVARGERSRLTLEGYERFLPRAAVAFGDLAADELRPHHVETWLDVEAGWGATSRFNAITAVKAALNWAKKAGHLEANPIADLSRPTPQRREAIPSDAQVRAIFQAVGDDPFRDLLFLLARTGCRPGELYDLAADQVDLAAGVMSVRNKTRTATGDARRTVPLTAAALDLLRSLIARHPTGPLLRNRSGEPWRRNAVAWRFKRLRSRLGLPPRTVAYTLRHKFVTDALEAGVDLATLCEIVGHRDATMIMRRYSKLRHRTEHLRRAVALVNPDDGASAAPRSDPVPPPPPDAEAAPSAPRRRRRPRPRPSPRTARGRRPDDPA